MNIDEYRDVRNTSQHEISSPYLDSHEAAAGVFARATFETRTRTHRYTAENIKTA